MTETQPTLNRRKVVERILNQRGDALLVTGLGSSSWDAAAAGDQPANFYLWGAMGGAAMVGLGIALAQPGRRVLVITGDGETGMQEGHTGAGVDLPAMAAAAGWPETACARTWDELEALVPVIVGTPGPVFVSVKVVVEQLPLVLPPRDGTVLRARFRAALLGEAADE